MHCTNGGTAEVSAKGDRRGQTTDVEEERVGVEGKGVGVEGKRVGLAGKRVGGEGKRVGVETRGDGREGKRFERVRREFNVRIMDIGNVGAGNSRVNNVVYCFGIFAERSGIGV